MARLLVVAAAALLVIGCSMGETVASAPLSEEVTFVATGGTTYGIAMTLPGASSDDLDDLRATLDCEITTADGNVEVDTGNVNRTVITLGSTTRWHTFTPPEGQTRVRCSSVRGGGRGTGSAELRIVQLED